MLSHSSAWKLMDTETFETLDKHLHIFFFLDEHMHVLFYIIVLCYKVDPKMGLKGCQCL